MSDGARVWYFAYGSNMQPATFAERRGIAPSRALVARTVGWRLVLDKTPLIPIGESFANLMPEEGAETFGVLYEIGVDDMAHIDLTEGVLIENYSRIEIPVFPLGATTPERAFTLISDKRSPELKPSHRYMALVIEGAEHHDLPAEWIAMLRTIPTVTSSPEALAGRRMVDAALASVRRGTSS